MSLALARELLAHALPILVAQLSSIGMMLVDTVVLGHVGSDDLAAVAIGGGLHVSLLFALIGVLQALMPMVARARGAGLDVRVAAIFQQGIWLSLLLSLPGIVLLLNADGLLALAGVDGVVGEKVGAYLAVLAIGVVPALIYRCFYFLCNALGQPRVLMLVGIVALFLHAFLAWGLAAAGWLESFRGVLGCALSNVLIAWLACLFAVVHARRGSLRRWRLLTDWGRPDRRMIGAMLRLGLPMGASNFIEITAFTLVALLVAPLGATVVAGHRIVANLSALTYMLPLSLGIATLAAVGQAIGAHELRRARQLIVTSLLLSSGLAVLVGVGLWWGTQPITAAYTDDPRVQAVAAGLVAYIAVYQFFDALQTIAGHALRAFHVTFLPMLVQSLCFWGVGLGGGWWLCYRWNPSLGVAGFWLAALLSLVLAAILLGWLLWESVKASEASP